MRITIIGGAGMLGTHVVPHLASRNQVRVLDRVPIEQVGGESLVGDARSTDDVAAAVAGSDAVVHMAAVIPHADTTEMAAIQGAFDVNVASIHLAMTQAAAAGVSTFVHISTMSVFADYRRYPIDPTGIPECPDPYGLTKRLGEQVCAAMAPELGIAASSLRLIYPTPDADWPAWRPPRDRPPRSVTMDDGSQIPGLAASDLATAIEAAAVYHGPHRAFTVTADVEGVSVLADDTPDVLGWRPHRRPEGSAVAD